LAVDSDDSDAPKNKLDARDSRQSSELSTLGPDGLANLSGSPSAADEPFDAAALAGPAKVVRPAVIAAAVAPASGVASSARRWWLPLGIGLGLGVGLSALLSWSGSSRSAAVVASERPASVAAPQPDVAEQSRARAATPPPAAPTPVEPSAKLADAVGVPVLQPTAADPAAAPAAAASAKSAAPVAAPAAVAKPADVRSAPAARVTPAQQPEPPPPSAAAPSRAPKPESAAAPDSEEAKLAAADHVNAAQHGGAIDAVLDDAFAQPKPGQTGQKRSQAALAAPDALPVAPSRDDVTKAMSVLIPAIRGCAQGQSGLATVSIVVKNDGRVESAALSGGPFEGTASGRCMEGVVRRARLPKFQQASFRLRFPFSIQ
jgi:hypothetical protein